MKISDLYKVADLKRKLEDLDKAREYFGSLRGETKLNASISIGNGNHFYAPMTKKELIEAVEKQQNAIVDALADLGVVLD